MLFRSLEGQWATNERALEYMSNNVTDLDLEEFGDVDVDVADDTLESWNRVVSVLSSQIDKVRSKGQYRELWWERVMSF